MRPHLFKTLAAAAVAMGAQTARAAPVLHMDHGQVTSIDGLVVQGGLYDVRFEHGRCVDIMPAECGPNSAELFTFPSKADATAAAQALMQQVALRTLIGTSGEFRISQLSGCDDWVPYTGRTVVCQIETPYARDASNSNLVSFVTTVQTTNFIGQVVDPTRTIYDLQPSNHVWAVWSAEAPETLVPEPATASMLASAAAGLAATRGLRTARRRRLVKPA